MHSPWYMEQERRLFEFSGRHSHVRMDGEWLLTNIKYQTMKSARQSHTLFLHPEFLEQNVNYSK